MEAIKLSRSMMNASLSYRVTVRNGMAQTATAVSLSAELVSARQGEAVTTQLANAATPMKARHDAAQLGPGTAETFTGSLQLPVRDIARIAQGNGAIYVPLMQWRVTANGIDPQTRTYVVGRKAQGDAGKLQPFPLDGQLRSFDDVSQRALD